MPGWFRPFHSRARLLFHGPVHILPGWDRVQRLERGTLAPGAPDALAADPGMSSTSNKYWNGEEHAVLRAGDVSAPWATEGRGIELANRAFCLYYHGVRNVQASRGDENHEEMWGSLSRCATNRRVGVLDFRSDLLGRKVLSLQAAFQHLEENDGRWTDENTLNYSGKAGRGFTNKAPHGPAVFLASVDAELEAMVTNLGRFQASCQELSQRRPSAHDGSRDWQEVRNLVNRAMTAAERSRPILWLGTSTISARLPVGRLSRSVSGLNEALDGHLTRTVKVFEVFNQIADALDIYMDETHRPGGGDRNFALGLAALNFAMTLSPVLGAFYGPIISRIPGLMTDWERSMANYHDRRLNAVAHEMTGRPRAPANCQYCGKPL
jgi:hypothetical protein